MFCPSCKDEFRSGFTRCTTCDVDLVEDLSQVKERGPDRPAPPMPLRMAEYCGFFSLDEAREARDQLRTKQIRSDIVIREAQDADFDKPVEEECWLRVDSNMFRQASALLDEDQPSAGDASSGEKFNCSDCGHSVNAQETFCAKCGARFDD